MNFSECETNLFNAARTGDLDTVEDIIENTNYDYNLDTLMSSAINNNKVEIVKYLYEEQHIYIDTKTIDIAIINGYTKIIKYFIQKRLFQNYYFNPLRLAAKYNKFEIVKLLIGKNYYGPLNNILGLFDSHNNFEAIEYLLSYGANKKCLLIKNKYLKTKIRSLFLLDFHFKRELILHQDYLSDCNILKIVFSYI